MSDALQMPDSLFELGLPDWSGNDVVRTITAYTGCEWLSRYHYLGTPPGGGSLFYGVFAPDMKAVVALANPTNASGVGRLYGLEAWRGNVEIARVAVHPDAPRLTASKSIAAVCKTFHASTGIDWLFSYADTGQNHHGGIYQALNAVYVGVSAAERGYRLDGNVVHPRTMVANYGTRANAALREMFGDRLEIVEGLNTAKHTYILPIGDRRSRKSILKHLRQFEQPYPKRHP